MGKYIVQTAVENCTGCLRCQLACSDAYAKAFNPSAAYIRVDVSGAYARIEFTEDCNECGICADSCFFEALSKTRKEDEQ